MNDSIIEFYETLAFEETETDDGFTALSCETDQEGNYVLVTDDDGSMISSLDQPLLFTYYTAEGSFQWSTGFKNSYLFKDYWSKADLAEEKLKIIRDFRDNKEWYKNP